MEALLEGHFVDELTVDEERELREALRASPELKERYDEQAEVLRLVAGSEPTKREGQALWARLEAELDAPKQATEAQVAPRPRGWFHWLSAVVAASLVAGMLYFGLQSAPPRAPQRTIKGGSTLGARWPALGRVALEVYAIRRNADGSFATPRRVSKDNPETGLTLDDYVQFRYASEVPELRYLYLGAIRRGDGAQALEGAARLYYPRPGQERPLTIEQSAAMQTVGRSIRLGAKHRAGVLTLVAVFSAKEQPRALVEQTLEALATGKEAPFARWEGGVAVIQQPHRIAPRAPAKRRLPRP